MQHILSILSGTRASLDLVWGLRLRLQLLLRLLRPLLIMLPPLVLLPAARPPLCAAAI